MGSVSDKRRARERARRPSKARLKSIRTPKKSSSSSSKSSSSSGGGGSKSVTLSQAEAIQLKGVAAREGAEAAAKAAEKLKAEKAKSTVSLPATAKGRKVQVAFSSEDYKRMTPEERRLAVERTVKELEADKAFKSQKQVTREARVAAAVRTRELSQQYEGDINNALRDNVLTARELDALSQKYNLSSAQQKELAKYGTEYEKASRRAISPFQKSPFEVIQERPITYAAPVGKSFQPGRVEKGVTVAPNLVLESLKKDKRRFNQYVTKPFQRGLAVKTEQVKMAAAPIIAKVPLPVRIKTREVAAVAAKGTAKVADFYKRGFKAAAPTVAENVIRGVAPFSEPALRVSGKYPEVRRQVALGLEDRFGTIPQAAKTAATLYATGIVVRTVGAVATTAVLKAGSATGLSAGKFALARGVSPLASEKIARGIVRSSRILTRSALPAAVTTFSAIEVARSPEPFRRATTLGIDIGGTYLASQSVLARRIAAPAERTLFFAERESDIARVLPSRLYGKAFTGTTPAGVKEDLSVRQVLKAQEKVARALQKIDPSKLTARELYQIKTETFSNRQLRNLQKIFTKEGVIVGGSAATQQQLLKTATQYKAITPKTRDPTGLKIIQKRLPVVTTKQKIPSDLDVFVPDAKIGSPSLQFLKLSKGFDVKPTSSLDNFYGFKPKIVTTKEGLKVVGLPTQYVKALQGTTNLGQADSGLRYYLDVAPKETALYRMPKDTAQVLALTRESAARNLLPKSLAKDVQTISAANSYKQTLNPVLSRVTSFKQGAISKDFLGQFYKGKLPIAQQAPITATKSPSAAPSAFTTVFKKSKASRVSKSITTKPSKTPRGVKSPSVKVSSALSKSVSPSAFKSSFSVSASRSVSPSVSKSPSPSRSFSPSASPSASPSVSPSLSPSFSFSPSPSISPSISFSPSFSPSPPFSPSSSIRPPPSITRVPPPTLNLNFGIRGPKVTFGVPVPRKLKQPKRYTPTLRAALGGIKGRKGKKFKLTGLEERPILY